MHPGKKGDNIIYFLYYLLKKIIYILKKKYFLTFNKKNIIFSHNKTKTMNFIMLCRILGIIFQFSSIFALKR